MDPYTEQRLREEVSYLHSLWHQGPPSNPNPNRRNPNPNPTIPPHFNPNSRNRHQFSDTQSKLKPVSNKFKKKGKRNGKKLPPTSDLEWPCNEVDVTPASSSGWRTFDPLKTKPVRLPNAEERALLDAVQIQQKVLKATQKFFAENEDSDGGMDSDDDNGDDDMMDEDGNAQYNFFLKLFEEDGELKGYYEKNNENGEFSCLVCGGIGKKVGKRFKNCVALVQHSVTIAKTKKKAHRAYSQVICKVLGWDIKRLPSMPSTSNKLLDVSKGNAEVASDSLTNNKKDSELDNVDLKDPDVNQDEELPSSIIPEPSTGDNVMPSEGNLDVGIGNISDSDIDTVLSNCDNGETHLKEKEADQFVDVDNCIIPGITDKVNGDMVLCESSLKVDDADKGVESIESGVPNADGNSSGVVNQPECNEDGGVGGETEGN